MHKKMLSSNTYMVNKRETKLRLVKVNSPLTKSDFADSVRIGGQFGANRDDDGSGERSAR